MTHYAYDANGWYTGPVADDAPNSTPIEPPVLATDKTPGAPRSVWARVAWYVVAVPIPPVPTVPASVTMRQARLALLGAGMLQPVDAAIAAMPSPAKEAAQIEWEFSNEVQRHNGFVEQLGPALGLTPAQVDALFVAAAKL